MNRLVEQLARYCRDHPLDEKWLIAPSLRVGWQWITCAARGGTPIVNAHCKTVRRMALDLASPAMRQQNARYLAMPQSVVFMDAAWRSMKGEGHYFQRLRPGMELFAQFVRSFDDIRLAGLNDIPASKFDSEEKHDALRRLFLAYRDQCQSCGFMDYADVLRLAAESITRQGETRPALLLPSDLDLNQGEQRLLRLLQPSIVELLPDEASPDSAPQIKTNLDLLRWFAQPEQAPTPARDQTVSIFHAVGESNEVREIFRRCVKHKLPLDEVEIICGDPAMYLPLIYEISMEADCGALHAVPATFADGIPVSYTKPGKALSAWLEWIKSGCLQSRLARMMRDDLLRWDVDKSQWGNVSSAFRRMKIGFGRERTLDMIQAEIEAAEESAREGYGPRDDESEAERDAFEQRRKRKLETLLILRRNLSALINITPTAGGDAKILLRSAIAFTESFANAESQMDQYGRNRILQELQAMQESLRVHQIVKPAGPINAPETKEEFALDLWDWTASLPKTLTVMGCNPKPGHIHASSISAGGHSGRRHVFILGLDESRFPLGGSQDPLLLDSEREALSENLATSKGRMQKSLDHFARLLCRQRGRLTLSFSSRNVQDDRDMFASSPLLAIFRLISGNHQGDYSDLQAWLGKPVSFAPAAMDELLHERESWRLHAGKSPLADWLIQRFPHFAQGEMAARSRESSEFTIYDGWVQQAGADLDLRNPNSRPVSASVLELLGKCPLAYFFRHGLKLEPPDELEVTDEHWLDSRDLGRLIHELFEQFVSFEIEHGAKRPAQEKRDHIQELKQTLIEQYRRLFPPVSPAAFDRQCAEIEQCANTFLKEQSRVETQCQPMFVEAKIGMAPREEESDAVSIPLPDGAAFQARGIVDRIDLVLGGEENRYAIVDYKTGGTYKYRSLTASKPEGLFHQGRVLQHALYIQMVQRWLAQTVSNDAKVKSFSYFFPGSKGKGERMQWDAQEFADAGNVFFQLCRLVNMGAFIATNQAKDCEFCAFLPICGNPETVAARSKAKLSDPLNAPIQPMKELRRDDFN